MNGDSRERYLDSMKSSGEVQYAMEQQKLRQTQMMKQQVVHHRNMVFFGSDEQKRQIEKHHVSEIDLQREIKSTMTQLERAEMNVSQPVDSIAHMQGENMINTQYRKQMAKDIQNENKVVAEYKIQQEKDLKKENQSQNSDQFIDYSKRNVYFF